MIDWQSAIEIQDELRHWWRGGMARALAQTWFRKTYNPDHPQVGFNADGVVLDTVGAQRAGVSTPGVDTDLAELQSNTMDHATLYWIAPQMVDLIEVAAPKMPDYLFRREDLPCECGFAVFARPMVYPDTHGKCVNVSGLSWRPVNDVKVNRAGVVVAHYSDVDGVDDYGTAEMVRERGHGHHLPRLLLLHVEVFVFGEPLVPEGFPRSLKQFEGKSEKELEAIRETVVHQRKGPLAFWTLVQQPLAVIEERTPHRTIRRRMEKAGSTLSVNTIRVVDLRRLVIRDRKAENGEPVAWSHRWIVSGHWRNVWHATKGRHVPQWIHPYIKGPDDRPIVVKKTVHRLVR